MMEQRVQATAAHSGVNLGVYKMPIESDASLEQLVSAARNAEGRLLSIYLAQAAGEAQVGGSSETVSVGRFECVKETHISWILMLTNIVLKVKKPVKNAFLDYSSLDRRKQMCEREIQLDRRYSRGLYLGVTAFVSNKESGVELASESTSAHASPSGSHFEAPGTKSFAGAEIIEWAVVMKRFPDNALLADRLELNQVEAADVEALATSLANFHASAKQQELDGRWAAASEISRDALQNIDTLIQASMQDASAESVQQVQALQAWTKQQIPTIEPFFTSRKSGGYIRECHGDLHASNIVWWDEQWTPFDGVEFKEEFRWIDPISDLAFLAMDLHVRSHPGLAHLVLNTYLELSSDYGALHVWRWYLVYRALVRAKVSGLLIMQLPDGSPEIHGAIKARAAYIAFAHQTIQLPQPYLAITHGFSGSGKSTRARRLVELHGALRLRADVERKKLFDWAPSYRPTEDEKKRTYSAETTQRVYKQLGTTAEQILSAGMSVVIDATFLQGWQRSMMLEIANANSSKFRIIDCQADELTLRRRITARQAEGQDASDADSSVLAMQMKCEEPLTSSEMQMIYEQA